MREQRKRLVGRVTSDKMQKTVVVSVENLKRHPLYNKVIRQTTKYKAHNPNDAAKMGDLVQIVESHQGRIDVMLTPGQERQGPLGHRSHQRPGSGGLTFSKTYTEKLL
jgi:small subunit ribosomal protein S17